MDSPLQGWVWELCLTVDSISEMKIHTSTLRSILISRVNFIQLGLRGESHLTQNRLWESGIRIRQSGWNLFRGFPHRSPCTTKGYYHVTQQAILLQLEWHLTVCATWRSWWKHRGWIRLSTGRSKLSIPRRLLKIMKSTWCRANKTPAFALSHICPFLNTLVRQ